MIVDPRALFPLPEAQRFGQRLARAGRLRRGRLLRHTFPDGETLIRVEGSAAQTAVVVAYLDRPNAKVVDVLLAADALRHAGAQRLILVAPYLPYMRQDRVFRPGEPCSQKLFGKMLRVGFDAVVTVQPHLHRVRRLSEVVPGRAVSAAPAIARWLRGKLKDAWIVGPDAESERWVAPVAKLLRRPWFVGEKKRRGDRSVTIRFPKIPPATRVVLIDDVASSGGTLMAAAERLYAGGAAEVHAVVVHALFDLETAQAMRGAGIVQIVSCDTVPHPTNGISCIPELLDGLAPYLER